MIRPVGRPSPSRLCRSPRCPTLLASLLVAGAVAGCGSGGSGPTASAGSASARPTVPPPAQATHRAAQDKKHAPTVTASRKHKAKARPIAPRPTSRAIVAKVDASSDAALRKAQSNSSTGQASVSRGAQSDAEVRAQIAEAQKAGYVLPSGDTAQSFSASVVEASISNTEAFAVGASIPVTAWNPRRRPIADWIVPVLQWAYAHGWTGTVTSGYRTFFEQAALNAAGAFSAPAGASNHESTAYPGGAVDVTEPAQLIQVLAKYTGPRPLNGGVLGPIDPEHFSATGE